MKEKKITDGLYVKEKSLHLLHVCSLYTTPSNSTDETKPLLPKLGAADTDGAAVPACGVPQGEGRAQTRWRRWAVTDTWLDPPMSFPQTLPPPSAHSPACPPCCSPIAIRSAPHFVNPLISICLLYLCSLFTHSSLRVFISSAPHYHSCVFIRICTMCSLSLSIVRSSLTSCSHFLCLIIVLSLFLHPWMFFSGLYYLYISLLIFYPLILSMLNCFLFGAWFCSLVLSICVWIRVCIVLSIYMCL